LAGGQAAQHAGQQLQCGLHKLGCAEQLLLLLVRAMRQLGNASAGCSVAAACGCCCRRLLLSRRQAGERHGMQALQRAEQRSHVAGRPASAGQLRRLLRELLLLLLLLRPQAAAAAVVRTAVAVKLVRSAGSKCWRHRLPGWRQQRSPGKAAALRPGAWQVLLLLLLLLLLRSAIHLQAGSTRRAHVHASAGARGDHVLAPQHAAPTACKPQGAQAHDARHPTHTHTHTHTHTQRAPHMRQQPPAGARGCCAERGQAAGTRPRRCPGAHTWTQACAPAARRRRRRRRARARRPLLPCATPRCWLGPVWGTRAGHGCAATPAARLC
jgi:hypothetical protein